METAQNAVTDEKSKSNQSSRVETNLQNKEETEMIKELNDLETFRDLNEYWRIQDVMETQRGQDQEEETTEYRSIKDRNLDSHMRFHLREEVDVRNFWDGIDEGQCEQYNNVLKSRNKYSVLIATDFTFPKSGGVETHGYQLAQCLLSRGHKVSFLTNNVKNTRSGVRVMENGMKCYHLAMIPIIANGDVSFFTFWLSYPVLRQIFIREHIDICHTHQSTSIIQQLVLIAAKCYGIKTVNTEHSLFGYQDAAGVHLNKFAKWSVRDLDAAICVSNACKDNFCLRTKYNPAACFTIPNAVDSVRFYPDFSIREREPEGVINIVFISRMSYRKGVDLLLGLIPKIVALFPQVNFIIGGDGEKMVHLKKLVDEYDLHDRVELLGMLKHKDVRDVMCRGHIFLNTSLTESFCIAILEAACCGLLVVSTDVGGVPEVLPPYMALLSRPEENQLFKQLCIAINKVNDTDTSGFYDECRALYSWYAVAERTERVYDYVMDQPSPNVLARIKTSLAWGVVTSFFSIGYQVFEAMAIYLVEIVQPAKDIDICRNFDTKSYQQYPSTYGNLRFAVGGHQPADIKAPAPEESCQTHYNIDHSIRYSTPFEDDLIKRSNRDY